MHCQLDFGYFCFYIAIILNYHVRGFIGNTSEEICNGVVTSSPSLSHLRRPTITIDGSRYIDGVPINVRVDLNTRFQAVVIQARKTGSPNPVGTFSVAPQATVYSCIYNNDTLVYKNENGTSYASFSWRPPDKESETISFIATVYQSERVYWSNITSGFITKGFKPIDVSTCGTKKGCYRYATTGTSCTFDDCDYVVTYTVKNDIAEFEISAKAQWAAIGFSSDRLMGGDDVLICLPKNNRPSAERAINIYRHQSPSTPAHSDLLDVEAQSLNGRISCRLTRSLKLYSEDSYTVDLTGEWYQLYAWGPVSRTGTIHRHTLSTPPSSEHRLYLSHYDNVVSRGQRSYCSAHISVTVAAVAFYWKLPFLR